MIEIFLLLCLGGAISVFMIWLFVQILLWTEE